MHGTPETRAYARKIAEKTRRASNARALGKSAFEYEGEWFSSAYGLEEIDCDEAEFIGKDLD